MAETKQTAMSALVEIQGTLKAPKGKHNKFGGFDYRSKEDILQAIKPLLHPLGCFVTVDDTITLIGDRYYLCSTAILRHPASDTEVCATSYAREPLTRKGMDDSQLTGTAASYAGKRALGNLFALDDTADADAIEQPQEKPQQKPKNGSNKPKQNKKQQTPEEIAKRVKNGIKALESLGVMTHEEIVEELNKIETGKERLNWLTEAYKNLKEGLE